MILNQRVARFGRLGALLCAMFCATPALGQLRIVDYNTATATNGEIPRPGMSEVLEAIGIETKNSIQRPIDILSIQETGTGYNGAQNIVNLLNGIYGPGTYARSNILQPGQSTDGTTQAVIYNTQTVQLIDQVKVGTASTSGYPRAPLRFEFRPVGYDSNADFYLYSSHYKAGDTSTDQTRRLAEAQTIRFDSDALGAGTPILYTGDYNIQSSSEAMYTTLLAAGNGQAVDPISTPGTWHNNAGFAAMHTQAPQLAQFDGLSGGGMDDRFDFQLVTNTVKDGEGLSYIGLGVPNTSVAPSQHSYHAFGNNGTTYNTDINNASNTALPVSEYNPDIGAGEPSRATVLNSLYTASDHLPVVADYQLPARLGAAVDAVPTQVIKDTPLATNVHVSNTAPVAVAIGADELDYNYSGSGSASGGGAGMVLPLAGADSHVLSLNTGTLGPQVGSINVTGTSQQVSNGVYNDVVNYTVLDHAVGDFVDATAPQTLDIDFGMVILGAGTTQEAFNLTNLAGVYRADLDMVSFMETGDVANRFTTDLSLFSGLAAGMQTGEFHAMFTIDQLGTFSATYQLDVADAAGVFGGTTDVLTLNLFGTVVVPEPAGCLLGVLALAGLLAFSRRRARITTTRG
jgi:hypothetical protein